MTSRSPLDTRAYRPLWQMTVSLAALGCAVACSDDGGSDHGPLGGSGGTDWGALISGGAPSGFGTGGGLPTMTGGSPVGPVPGSGGALPGAGGAVQPGSGGALPGAGGAVPPGSGGALPGGAAGAPPAGGEICTRWNADRANLDEGVWSGNVDACDAGDMAPAARDAALRLLNLYRFMSGLDPIQMDPEFNRKAQACALLQRANGTLSHEPPPTWKCYTEEAADAASNSSISSGRAVGSVDGYMIDPGNPTTIGHRRWILSNWIGPVGFGSTDRSSCEWNTGVRGSVTPKDWAAWPAGGQIPLQALVSRRDTVDSTGWSLQSDKIALSGAQITVTSDGATLPVTVTPLLPNYGSSYALRFNPQGWTTTAGRTYSVSVTGIATPITYDVQVVDCSQ